MLQGIFYYRYLRPITWPIPTRRQHTYPSFHPSCRRPSHGPERNKRRSRPHRQFNMHTQTPMDTQSSTHCPHPSLWPTPTQLRCCCSDGFCFHPPSPTAETRFRTQAMQLQLQLVRGGACACGCTPRRGSLPSSSSTCGTALTGCSTSGGSACGKGWPEMVVMAAAVAVVCAGSLL
jgi:hypothetical protein